MNHTTGKTKLAKLTITCAVISLLSLLSLHFVSPEFDPSWRMISEYALGDHGWLITLFFIFWGASSFCIILVLWNIADTKWSKVGVILLCLSFAGQIMGGLFDVRHSLHGLAFLIGVPSLPAAALLVSYQLVKKEDWKTYRSTILFSAHFTWISLVLMIISMVLMISGFQKAGIPMGEGIEPPKSVPHGVIAVNGYANRLLVLAYLCWPIIIAKTYLNIQTKNK